MHMRICERMVMIVCLTIVVCSKILAGTTEDILSLTAGQQVKMVWEHCVRGEGTDWDATGSDYELMGYDTAIDTQPHVILPGPASYANPCISPSGTWVLYTDTTTNVLYKVKMDGTAKQEITKGYLLCTWRNPADQTEWVYFTEDGNSRGRLVRCRLDEPAKREVMLSTIQTAHTLSVSADGTRAGSEFPWPNAGVAYLPDRGWRQYGGGCNASIAPDDSYRFFHMHHSHESIQMYEDGGVQQRMILTQPIPKQNAWVPRWSTDVRFLTITAPIAGTQADVYLGSFDNAFNKVEKWVKVSSAPGQDTKAYAWIDMGLGQFAGEVPYTITVPTPSAGEWRWDFGDGTVVQTANGSHTYTKPGTYSIIAKSGEQTLKGRMEAQIKSVPKVSKVIAVDARNINIIFTKAMTATKPVFTFDSRTEVERWRLSGDERELILTMKGNLPAEDTLAIQGFTDQNQQPNVVEIKDVKIKVPEWPVKRTDMLYRWENGLQKNLFSLDATTLAPVEIEPQGVARLGRYGEMVLGGGSFVNVDMYTPVWAWLLNNCSRSNEFSVELVMTPADLTQGTAVKPATIISIYGDGPTQRGFRLGQVQDQLILQVNQQVNQKDDEKSFQLGALPDANTHHVMVTFGKGNVCAYLDGKPMKNAVDINPSIPGQLSWGAVRHLALGGDPVYEMVPWQGRVEALAVYARTLPLEEAVRNAALAQQRVASRKMAPQFTGEFKLKAKSVIPAVSDILPYTRTLVVYEYELVRAIAGTRPAQTIRVVHWGIHNSRKLAIETIAINTTTTLTLEKFADRLDLQNEMLIDSLPDNPDVDLYVESD